MKSFGKTVIGIDVGGCGKGFHAVALRGGRFEPQHFRETAEVARWCGERDAQAIAVDAPCEWADSGRSREAERRLKVKEETIQYFKTPTRTLAKGRAFFDWVFNGEILYQCLRRHYQLYDGTGRQEGLIVFETFPHAVVCALAGRLVPARPKAKTRRSWLQEQGYDDAPLANIDFVDAALCALTAEQFLLGQTQQFGDVREGFIVVPK